MRWLKARDPWSAYSGRMDTSIDILTWLGGALGFVLALAAAVLLAFVWLLNHPD